MQRALSALFGGTANNQEGLFYFIIEFNVFFREWQGKNVQLGALIKN
jgi:hypothetical protein